MKKEFLWAPWRMKYITSPKTDNNIFLEKSKSKEDRKNLVLYRGKLSFVLMNIYPYNNGHFMIAPYRQYDDMTNLNEKTLFEIMKLAQESMTILKKTLKSDGFNFGLNISNAIRNLEKY